MEKTAVDLFAEKLVELNKAKIALTSNDIIKLSKEANEIHKQQVCKAFSEADIHFAKFKTPDEYYKGTFILN